jgi:hypothetical protein
VSDRPDPIGGDEPNRSEPIERDSIVMAADAAKAWCIARLQRAIRETERLRAMPLTADECVTILQHSTWEDDLPPREE